MLGRIRFRFSSPGASAVFAAPRVVEHILHAGVVLEPGQFLLSERQGENETLLRIFCDTPPQRAVPVTPNLEDAFLAIYREGQV